MIHTGGSAASFFDLLRVHASPMRASALLRTPDEIRPIKHNDCIKNDEKHSERTGNDTSKDICL